MIKRILAAVLADAQKIHSAFKKSSVFDENRPLHHTIRPVAAENFKPGDRVRITVDVRDLLAVCCHTQRGDTRPVPTGGVMTAGSPVE